MEPVNKDGLTEAEFLKQYKPKDYPRPSVTADILIFAVNKDYDRLKVLLIKRKNHPYIGCRALPGGFVGIDESCEAAAVRELREETGIENIYLEQLCTVSKPNRDPRMRIISVAYMALINQESVKPIAGDDADAADWFEITEEEKGSFVLTNGEERLSYTVAEREIQNGIVKQRMPEIVSQEAIAFDHGELIHTGLLRLRNKAVYTPLLFSLMDKEFTLPQLQKLYETVLGKNLYKSNFRDNIKKYVAPLGKKQSLKAPGRAAELYSYKGED